LVWLEILEIHDDYFSILFLFCGMKSLVVVFFFFALSFSSFSQSKDFLLLKRGANQKSQIRFYLGEDFTYKSDKLTFFVTDRIVSLDQDFIYLTENILRIDNIKEIDIQRKDPRNKTLRNLTALFLGAGTILLGAESINSIYHTERFSIDQSVGITSAILIGTGLALLPVRYKTFKNEGRNKIQIIRMRMDN
jgi:hypothetical protein